MINNVRNILDATKKRGTIDLLVQVIRANGTLHELYRNYNYRDQRSDNGSHTCSPGGGSDISGNKSCHDNSISNRGIGIFRVLECERMDLRSYMSTKL